MALPFIPSDAGLLALQAGVVAAPRPVPRVAWLERFRGRGWALVPIGSIVVVIFAIRYVSGTATGLTDLALVAVPILAAVALGWAMRGARPLAALAAIPLFVLAWRSQNTLAGEAAGALLSALSCVTLGVLLSAVTPPRWLKVGIVLMAAADVWLVASDLLQSPNSVLVAAQPPAGLPQLQAEVFGTVSMGYGDLFVAALLGAVLAAQWRRAMAGGGADARDRGGVRPAVPGHLGAARDRAGGAGAAGHRGLAEAQCPPSPPPVDAGGRDSSASEVIASVPRAASSSTSVASSAERA